MKIPESIVTAIDDTIYELTSVGTFVAVVIAGVIANNAIYYQTGLTSENVDVVIPCSIFGVWLMLIGIIYRDIERVEA